MLATGDPGPLPEQSSQILGRSALWCKHMELGKKVVVLNGWFALVDPDDHSIHTA
ncbi:MAG: hypothetical protein VX833_00095 [Actinomycetota bacterium]|nr:hypothetical protein [Actinomycetota bacterium]